MERQVSANMHDQSKKIALGGVLAALAVIFMCMGTMIPLATFVCPMLCMVTLSLVCRVAGKRMGWAWYACVAVLSVLLAPDKEAAAVFVFLGYYPILKPRMDKAKLSVLWKLMLFNVAIIVMYCVLIHMFGMAYLAAEFVDMGKFLTAVTLVLGNVCMLCLDMLLTKVGKLK